MDAAKENSRPQGIIEIEGYRESFRTEGGTSATRVFDVPWTQRKVFVDWALGHAVSLPMNPSGSNPYTAELGFGGGHSRGNAVALALGFETGYLSRIIPSQHPEMPWLYCTECDLQMGHPVLDERRDITVRRNADGGVYVAYDEGLFTSPDQLPLETDPAVISAPARYNAANARYTQATTFPLTFDFITEALIRFVNEPNDQTQARTSQILGFPNLQAYQAQVQLIADTADSLANLEQMANSAFNPFVVARAYLNSLAPMQTEIQAALDAVNLAAANAFRRAGPAADRADAEVQPA